MIRESILDSKETDFYVSIESVAVPSVGLFYQFRKSIAATANCRICRIRNRNEFPILHMNSFWYGWMHLPHAIRFKYHSHRSGSEFKCSVNFNFLTQNRLPFCARFFLSILFFFFVIFFFRWHFRSLSSFTTTVEQTTGVATIFTLNGNGIWKILVSVAHAHSSRFFSSLSSRRI